MENIINHILLHLQEALLFDTSGEFEKFNDYDFNDLQAEFLNKGYRLTTFEEATDFEKSEYYEVPHTHDLYLLYKT